ncbi:PEP-CTERM sorting domain-containing protein [Tundrisphaera sp. TA3]|uniref:PEP-CTERM sorting domain-containing protein n=1 Tax=Tundrisphaera sp. TA3 TaxID=3435775 RepID=UPI003EB9CB7E
MMNSRRILPAALFLALAASAPGKADFVLDQSNVITSRTFDIAVVSTQSVAQTFTVGVQGILARVDLQIAQSQGTTGDLLFSIRTTAGGAPNPDEVQSLFQVTIPLSSVPFDNSGIDPFTSIDISSAGIAVTPGQVLALSLSRTGPGTPPWVLWQTSAGSYSGGNIYTRSGTAGAWGIPPELATLDTGFRTYVTTAAVPEPGSLALCVTAGLMGLGAVRLRRRRAA